MKIDVCIPVFKPDDKLLHLIEMLNKQSFSVNKVILLNTEEAYFQSWIDTYAPDFSASHRNVLVHHITQEEFDHGRTRNQARSFCDADTEIIVYMTQDAIPADAQMIAALVEPLMEHDADISYARQIPAEKADVAECFTRAFNYPDQSQMKQKDDLGTMGIKTYFCSNVCAAYKRRTFEHYGTFEDKTIFNEDMIFAAKVIDNGGTVAYAAGAKVIHSHHYSNMQQLKRNFDLAVSQVEHPEVFQKVSSESEGVRYVKAAYVYFRNARKTLRIIPFVITCVYKYIGFWLGHRYRKLSDTFIMRCTMNQNYWRK